MNRRTLKALVLTHMTPEIDRPEVLERMRREAQAEFDGLVVGGEDLMRISVSDEGVVEHEA